MAQSSLSDSGILGKEQRIILLVGRCGNGKSSIGNSILGERYFTTGTQEYSLEPVIREKDDLKVIVCPFIGDTGDDISYKIGDIQEATRKMLQHLVTTGGSGIDAIVFVLKYGVRFTKQEKDAVTRVKEIFGDNVFSDFGIIAFSYGDLFDLDNSSQKIEFDDWCLQQSGYVKALFIECDYRCVLFNNKNTLGDTLQRQNTNLWECVATKYFENKKTSVQSCVDEAGKEMATKKDCAEETNKVNVTEENCAEETNKVNVTDENCAEKTNKVNITDENCAEETNKVNITDKNCAEETNKVNITDENCAEETNKVNVTDENCAEETNKVNITDENCDEETNKVNITDENCDEETNKVNITDENCAVNTEVVKEEITMNETEESYDFITEEEILEADGKQTTNVNVTGKDFALVTRNINTEIGDSALKHPKENTGNENTMQGNENEVRKDDKDIKEPESEYKEKRKITRKYTISDFDNRKHVPLNEDNKINDTPKNSCSFLSCFSLRST